uniref:J domain-containing protein n=1 Tax=viral metagenome TaxID=1070528 RepID=A0A6C0D5B2_9ZZZZ
MDLDITNYDYDDILKLFKVGQHFNEEDLKRAKKQVLASHPDKSGLDKSYFLFFSSAYKILFNIYNFREKHSSTTNLNNYNENYNADTDEANALLIHKITSNKSSAQFNSWFNEQFENFKITNDYEANGYGDWLTNADEEEKEQTQAQCKDLNSLHKIIEEKKQILRTHNLVKKRNVCEFNNTNYCDLTNSKPEDYSSGLFSKFQYEDLKKAHTESLIPVTNEDNINNYNSLEDIRNKRASQSLTPLKREEATTLLNKSKEDENNISRARAYSLFKQDELNKQKNEKFWSNLKRLN